MQAQAVAHAQAQAEAHAQAQHLAAKAHVHAQAHMEAAAQANHLKNVAQYGRARSGIMLFIVSGPLGIWLTWSSWF